MKGKSSQNSISTHNKVEQVWRSRKQAVLGFYSPEAGVGRRFLITRFGFGLNLVILNTRIILKNYLIGIIFAHLLEKLNNLVNFNKVENSVTFTIRCDQDSAKVFQLIE